MIPPLTKNYMKTPELQKDIATQYKLEQSGEIDKIIHLKLRLTQSQIPRMHGNPKIHKPRIIQYRNCWQRTVVVTKNVDKYISQILKQYIKETDHYIKNSKDFVNKCRDMKVETDETLVLYDVTALYPSVPQEEAIQVFHHELIPNNILETKMKPEKAWSSSWNMCANYVFHIQRETVQASRWLSYWCLNVRFCSWTLHAMFWIQTHSPTHHPHVDEIFAKLKISMWICFLAIWKVSIHE